MHLEKYCSAQKHSYSKFFSSWINFFDWFIFMSTPVFGLTWICGRPDSWSWISFSVSDGKYVFFPAEFSESRTSELPFVLLSLLDEMTIFLRSVGASIVSLGGSLAGLNENNISIVKESTINKRTCKDLDNNNWNHPLDT